MGASLYKLCVPSAFGGKAGFDMDAKCIFPQGVLAVTALVQGVTGDGGRQVWAGTFPLLSGLCQVWDLLPSCCSRSPGGWAQAGSVPLMCVFSSVPTLGPLPWSQGSTKAEGGSCRLWLVLATENCPGCLQRTACLDIHNCSLILCRCSFVCKFPLSLTAGHSPQLLPPLPSCGSTLQDGQGPHGLFACIGAEAAAARAAGCFQCSTRESANDRHPAPPELRLRYGHLSIYRLIFTFWHIKYSSHYVSKMK